MSNVLLTSDSRDMHEKVLAASDGACIALGIGSELPTEPAELVARSGQQTLPDVVILDATVDPEGALGLASRFDQELPGTGVVLIGDPHALAIPALRVGVRDVLPPSTDAAELRSTLHRVHAAVQLRRMSAGAAASPFGAPVHVPARVITVLSPKGGAGKTTLASNLAVGLAQAAPGSTVLVDLDVQFGDIATALGIEPEFTLEDVVHGAALRDPIALKTHLTLHESGLALVCAPENPVAADSVTPEQVSALLMMLASQFRYVVVDTAAGLDPRTLAALDRTTDPVLITTFDVTGARGLRKEVDTLRELGMLNSARHVVLNFADPKGGLTVSDVEATIRTRVDATLPISRAVTTSLNTGIPLLLQRPKDPVAKQVRQLIAHFQQQLTQALS
ncbi:AAA family ATPase [Agrococcus sp. HG114]|uniref:AAA family ATPase n=1 Tax=Agrococcus sp. HG114 TaxID=2969757 RepID=UPI00215B4E7A|nr:AAA family ATPase [Agrococcus sp. HG114]MCR8670694.1 P-loop NTPase [Agrococcus sp. HG114]